MLFGLLVVGSLLVQSDTLTDSPAPFAPEPFHTGGGTIALPGMGTLTIDDGMITVWCDYFDPTDFDRQLASIKR